MMRTSNCGELNSQSMDSEVSLCGWVDTRRDHGGLIFVDLRDRWGLTQVVFSPEQSKELHKTAETLRTEFVIQVKGKVQKRPEGTINKKIPTGEIEVHAQELKILNSSPTPPFELEEKDVNEELRLKYRFLDLRRREMVKNLTFRHRVSNVARNYLDAQKFLEIETPYLTKSTPEGARDYLVPARLNAGSFYALPQSPQLFKQMLMVAGYDRYYQFARCFRDEDLRSDRQPEHTQIDIEMSFVDESDVMTTVEGMVSEVVEKTIGKKLIKPFRRMPYDEAIEKYGSDKPDLRFRLELHDVSEVFSKSGFKVFDQVIDGGGKVRAICFTPPEGKEFSRKVFDDLTSWIQDFGAKGLAWMKVKSKTEVDSPIAKFFDESRIEKLTTALGANKGDVIFMVAHNPTVSAVALGALRNRLAHDYDLIDEDAFEILWIVDFPLFEWNEDEKRWDALHHPFTSPIESEGYLDHFDNDPGKLKARAYDLVLNGTEVGGGSIRIHNKDIQDRAFRALGISKDEAEEKFGFLLKALSYGAPPHGGLAMGLDRFVTLLLKRESIREVIAFPKTQKGTCLMTEAPSGVSERQLMELHLKVKATE